MEEGEAEKRSFTSRLFRGGRASKAYVVLGISTMLFSIGMK